MTDGGMTGYTVETAVSTHTGASGDHESDTHKPEKVYDTRENKYTHEAQTAGAHDDTQQEKYTRMMEGTPTKKDTHISEDTRLSVCVKQAEDTQRDSVSDNPDGNREFESSTQEGEVSYEASARTVIYSADPGSVTFDCKYYRMRIFKSVIRMLGNPPYIILLMDSASHEIAIMGQQEEIDDCLKVPEDLMKNPDVSFTLHARWYIKSVMSLMNWKEKSYRAPCVSIINETIPVFSLDQAAMLNGTEEL